MTEAGGVSPSGCGHGGIEREEWIGWEGGWMKRLADIWVRPSICTTGRDSLPPDSSIVP